MTCKRTDLGYDTTVWSCGRRGDKGPTYPPCSACGGRRDTHDHLTFCEFELRGIKAGQACGKPLCRGCVVKVGRQVLCPAHAKFLARMEGK
jgi:hypothetical protein